MMQGMRSETRTWHTGVLLLFAGAVLRLLFLRFHPPYGGDSLVYADLAHNLLKHHVYGLTEGGKVVPTLIRLPGYPLFLAACFSVFGDGKFLPALWIQLLVDLLSCGLLGVLAGRLMGHKAGLIALALAALCPFTAIYSTVPLTETWSLLCITLALFSLERWTVALRAGRAWNIWLLPMGLSLAYAVLLRPDRILVAVAVVPALLWTAWRESRGSLVKSSGPAVVVMAALALPLLLWGVRNWRVFHVVQPLAPKYANDPHETVTYGFFRWYRTWAVDFKSSVDLYWKYDDVTISLNDVPPRAFDNDAQREKTAAIFAQYNEITESTPEIDAQFAQLARERIRAHPLRYYVLLPMARLADMWLRPRTEFLPLPLDWWNWRPHPMKSLGAAAYGLLNAAYLLLALIGLIRWAKQDWSGQHALGVAMVAFVLLRSALLATLDNCEQRYTLECFPIVFLLASFAFCRSRRGISDGSESPSC